MNFRLKKIIRLLAYCLCLALLISTLNYPSLSSAANPQQSRSVVASPSLVLEDVSDRNKKQPSLTPKELAAYANALVEKRGFDYSFDLCGVFRRPDRLPPKSAFPSKMALAGGGKLTIKFTVLGPQDSLCSECWSDIPSLQVTKREMLVVTNGQRYRVKRPASFSLDEVELVDEKMKTVLRTWQVPFQSVPKGISTDGTKLYLGFYNGELDRLVLELSEDGRIKFRDRGEAQLEGEGEWIENHPKDEENGYLSFMRFRVGNKSHIIRFSAP